jgi:peptide/nickel transport system ATP-binding protein/oligopeptide transport system ATP-binding protein
MTSLIAAEGLVKHFALRPGLLGSRRGRVRALEGVDLAVEPGECLAVVGESGSGKSTLARLLVRLLEPTAGRVLFRGQDLATLGGEPLRRLRRRFQIVFQDPYGSLNPRMRIGRALAEPLAAHGLAPRGERSDRVAELLERVGLPRDAARRFPHEFSGGQRQRIAIARALATGPELIVADEPVSALDVSVRAQIVNLLAELQAGLGLGLIFIAHDLAVVEQIADRVAVLYLGRVVEQAERHRLFAAPQHPYTAGLLAAVPVPEPGRRRRAVVGGEPPSPVEPPSGCPFHPRCPIARPRCAGERPALVEVLPGHLAACHFPGETSPGEASLAVR